MSCPRCGAPRGTNKYCWNCVEEKSNTGFLLPEISTEDLIKYEIRNERYRMRSGLRATVEPISSRQRKSGRKK